MFELLVFAFFVLLAVFLGSYGGYYVFLRSRASRPWDLAVDASFEPSVSVLVPVHNEEKSIEAKLENVTGVSYPRGKLEVLVVDDASDDGTVAKAEEFAARNPGFELKVVRAEVRGGKSVALNGALGACRHPFVVVSDADAAWPSDALRKAVAFLADGRVGAVTGRGVNRVGGESWVTRGEDAYLRFAELVRLGESKVHSTIRFEGGLCVYRRGAFEGFDCVSGSDDSGTALAVVQSGFRTVLAPEALFYTGFPSGVEGKFRTKIRRANQLMGLWAKCFRLMLKGSLKLPKRIAVPEILLFMVDPVVFVGLLAVGLAAVAVAPFSWFSLFLLAGLAGAGVVGRRLFVELVIDNVVLFCALVGWLFGKRYVAWSRAD